MSRGSVRCYEQMADDSNPVVEYRCACVSPCDNADHRKRSIPDLDVDHCFRWRNDRTSLERLLTVRKVRWRLRTIVVVVEPACDWKNPSRSLPDWLAFFPPYL